MFKKIAQSNFFINYKRMWPFVRPYWVRALAAMLITIPIGSLDAVIAFSLKPFMDEVVMEQGSRTVYGMPLYAIPIFIIVFTLIQSFLEYGSAYLNTWVGSSVTMDVKKKLYKKLVYLDAPYMDAHSSGEIVARFDGDPNTACSGLLNNLKVFTTRVFSSVSLIGVLFYTSWRLAIIAIVVLGTALYPLTQIRKKIKEIAAHSVVAGGAALTTMHETYGGSMTIASYNLQSYQEKHFFSILRQLFKLGIKNTQRTAWLSPMMHIIISVGIAGTIWYGSYLIENKFITTGDFVAFMVSLLMLYTPVKNIGKNFASVQTSFLAVERIFKILDMPIKIKDSPKAKVLHKIQHDIQFQDVTFSYKSGVTVLDHVSFRVNKGETVAFVGNSGGGKTTIVNLLPRFYEINSGSITIDGTDIRDVTLKSLRDQIAVVFQDNFLFSGTIRENILLGKLDATEKEIKEAVKNACLDEFIAELKDGLDTFIGERGTLLSGGQKQRVAIARAFLKNAPIVILDEATSALDNKSEAIVQQAIDNLMQDRTVFVIAHRLSTIQNADKIIVINQGKIIESGTHEHLLARHQAYYSLYQAQFKK